MSILDFKITREEWIENVKNDNTRYQCMVQIKKWDKFLDSINQTDKQVLAEIKKNNDKPETYLFLNKYIQYLDKQNLKRESINLAWSVLRNWYAANGVMLYNEFVKRFMTFPKAVKELRVPLNNDIIRSLIHHSPKGVEAILMILLSSGMRVSECLQLKVKDIIIDSNPISIKIRAENTKTKTERLAYISNEAWEILQEYMKDKESNDLIFFNNWNRTCLINFEIRFSRVRKECGFIEKYDDNRTYHVNIHAFRANFMTLATKVLDGDTAHALLGHQKYLDQYYRLTDKEKGEMYHKLEPYLTVSDEARQRVIIQEKDQEINELLLMKEELAKQKAKIKRLENIR